MASIVEKSKNRMLEILKVSKDEIEKGLELYDRSIVIDSMTQDPAIKSKKMMKITEEMLDAGKSVDEVTSTLEKMRELELLRAPEAYEEYKWAWDTSGVTCISQTVEDNLRMRGSFEGTLRRISSSAIKLDSLKDVLKKAICVGDIIQAKKENKHAVMWNFQNTLILGGGVDMDLELDRLNIFYSLGVRIIQLTYNLRNFVGDGCTERYKSGLTYFGVNVVERLNELGILIDTSHCGSQTTIDAVEVSKAPVAATHTGSKTIYMHDRSKTDDELKAISEKDGYVGIYMVPAFIGKNSTIKEWLDHVDYIVNLVGVKHVGIGTDTGYSTPDLPKMTSKIIEEAEKPPSGRRWWLGWRPEHKVEPDNIAWEESRTGSLSWLNWPYYTVGLVSRGYSDQEIEGILGGNFLRILRNVIG
jgi:membrane dipeptidase